MVLSCTGSEAINTVLIASSKPTFCPWVETHILRRRAVRVSTVHVLRYAEPEPLHRFQDFVFASWQPTQIVIRGAL